MGKEEEGEVVEGKSGAEVSALGDLELEGDLIDFFSAEELVFVIPEGVGE